MTTLPLPTPDWQFGLSLCIVAERYILQQLWLNDTSYRKSDKTKTKKDLIFREQELSNSYIRENLQSKVTKYPNN